MEYKKNGNDDKNQESFDKVYDMMIRYAYWRMFEGIVKDEGKSIDETQRFYKRYRQHIDLNQKRFHDGYTVKGTLYTFHL